MKRSIVSPYFLAAATLLVFSAQAGDDTKSLSILNTKARAAVAFQENKGQVSDQHYAPRPDVLFSGNAGPLVFHLKKDGISYQLQKTHSAPGKKVSSELAEVTTTFYRLDLSWLHANANCQVEKSEPLHGYSNYYLPACPKGATRVKSYKNVIYKNLYEGIDLHYYEKNGALKYDYLVAPGADYREIRIAVAGATKIRILADGSLSFVTPLGEVRENAPAVFQNGRTLSSAWRIEKNVLSFHISGADKRYPLVIDPLLRAWGTYYGGSSSESFQSCTADSSGNIYGVGSSQTNVSNIIATSGSHQSTMSGGIDAFLVQFNSSGVRQWGTYFGGTFGEGGRGCATDQSGSIYMCGSTSSTVGIATSGAHQTVHAGGGGDGFLAKFNSAGVLQWSTYFGTTTDEGCSSVAVDVIGNVYASGSTETTIATPGAHQVTFGGGGIDAFLAKFSPTGVLRWSTMYGGSGYEQGYNASADALGNVYLGGVTSSPTTTRIATPGAFQTAYAGNNDGFIAKFDSAGTRIWGTYYGASQSEGMQGLSSDAAGNVYGAGSTTSSLSTMFATSGAHQTAYAGGFTDDFLVKFSPGGTRLWGTFFGGTGSEAGDRTSCTAIWSTGGVYLCGSSWSSSLATAQSQQTATAGGTEDFYVAMFAPSGTLISSTYFGGGGTDYHKSSCTDVSGRAVSVGYTQNGAASTNIAPSGAHQSGPGSSTDGIMGVFFNCIPPAAPSITSFQSTLCARSSNTLSATGTGTILWYQSAVGASLATGPSYITPTLTAGTYTRYAAASTCSAGARTPVEFTVLPLPVITVSSGTICSGSSFVFAPGGASSYSFNGSPTATVFPTSSTVYTVTGTSTAGCTNTTGVTATVTVNQLPVLSVNSGSICSGKSFTLQPSGAASYMITGGNSVVSPTVTSTYTVTGTSAAGCTNTTGVTSTVTVHTTPTITATGGTICQGNNFTISPSGANTYTYQGGQNIVSPSASTTYTVAGISAEGCVSAPVPVSVSVNPTPVLTVNSGSICSGNSFVITPAGGFTYNITNGSYTVSPTVTTSYSVTGGSAAGCPASNTAVSTVTVHTTPTVSINSGTICSGKTFTLVPSGADNYSITGGSYQVSPSASTSYTLTGYSSAGCVSGNSAIATVTVHQIPVISVNSGAICLGESFTITPTGAGTYTISSGANVVSPVVSSSYTITGTSSEGCPASNTVVANIVVKNLPNVGATAIPTIVCAGNSATLIGSGANTYTWSSGGNGAIVVVSPTLSTTFTVTGTGQNGCSAEFNVSVLVDPCLDLKETGHGALSFHVYPNPGSGNYVLEAGSATSLSVYDMLGKLIETQELPEGRSALNLTHAAAGMYILRFSQGTQVLSMQRVIKE